MAYRFECLRELWNMKKLRDPLYRLMNRSDMREVFSIHFPNSPYSLPNDWWISFLRTYPAPKIVPSKRLLIVSVKFNWIRLNLEEKLGRSKHVRMCFDNAVRSAGYGSNWSKPSTGWWAFILLIAPPTSSVGRFRNGGGSFLWTLRRSS